MAITSHDYPQFNEKLCRKLVDMSSDTLKVIALTAYTYNDSHATLADVLGSGTEVVTGNGYTAGGVTVAGVTLSTTSKVTTLTAASPAITVPQAGSLSFAFLVWFFDIGGTNTTRYPVLYDDMGGTFTYNDTAGGSEVVTLTVAAGGLKTLTAS